MFKTIRARKKVMKTTIKITQEKGSDPRLFIAEITLPAQPIIVPITIADLAVLMRSKPALQNISEPAQKPEQKYDRLRVVETRKESR